jgi:16S rRNA (adenine1518-N6/adenine1519-N6)-dimethyltransferase
MSVRPKKHLGQHFLVDENIARKITSSISTGCVQLLEIGPGKGILTKYLLTAYPSLRLIEIDPESVTYLKETYPQLKDRIIEGDFLKANLREVFSGTFSIIGNFPYNISSQILFKVLDHREQVTEVVGMFQKEVAERIAAAPGSKTYGILSVLVKAFYNIEYLFTVSETVFYPQPRVKSAVIRLTRNPVTHLECNEELFFRVVKTAFNQRRKTLRNALKGLLAPQEMAGALFSRRAEQLGVEEFVAIGTLVGSMDPTRVPEDFVHLPQLKKHE